MIPARPNLSDRITVRRVPTNHHAFTVILDHGVTGGGFAEGLRFDDEYAAGTDKHVVDVEAVFWQVMQDPVTPDSQVLKQLPDGHLAADTELHVLGPA